MFLSYIDYIIIGILLLLPIVIGLFVIKYIRTFEDFFVGGGRLTLPLFVCTLVSTYYELDVTFGTTEVAFYDGVVAWFWFSRPYYLAILLTIFIVGKKLSGYKNLISLGDYVEYKYGKPTRMIVAVGTFFYSLPISNIIALIILFNMLGLTVTTSLIIILGITAIYTSLGGFLADVLTDTVQFWIMCTSIVITLFFALNNIGGVETMKNELPKHYFLHKGSYSTGMLLVFSLTSLTVFTEPVFYQRMLAVKDWKMIRNAFLIGLIFWISYDWCVTMLGMLAKTYVQKGIISSDYSGSEAFVYLCISTLPIGLKGLFISGIFAASMSSIDSYSTIASSCFSYEIVNNIGKNKLTDKQLIFATRIGIVLIIVLSGCLALYFKLIAHAWIVMASVYGSITFVPTFFSYFIKNIPNNCGFYSTITGAIVSIIFLTLVHLYGQYDEEKETFIITIKIFYSYLNILREHLLLFSIPITSIVFFVTYFIYRNKKPSNA